MAFPRHGGMALVAILSLFALPETALSEAGAWEKPVLRLWEGIRANLREPKEDVPNEAFTRVEVGFFPKEGRKWAAFPFFESRLNLDEGEFSRVEAGAELGIQPLPWFYLGNALHHASLHPGDDHPEWEVRTVFSWPLPWSVRSEKMSLYALNEWTFNLGIGEGSRNEVGAGVRVPLPWKPFSSTLGWRHVDVIHASDMDQFEGTLRADF